MIDDRGTIAGNIYDKYGTKNPLARWLVARFLKRLSALCDVRPEERVVEIGCGEGDLVQRLQPEKPARLWLASDVSVRILGEARRRHRNLKVIAQSAYALALPDASVDVILASEVLEHLRHPDRFLLEIARVVRRRAVLTVPREPLWRALNVARLTYCADWGNTPGHVQHFSRRAFLALIERSLRVVAVRSALPWILVAAEPRR